MSGKQTHGKQTDAIKFTAMTLGAVALGRLIWRKMTEYDLRNKTVLVTGGSRGLGLVLAREFAREGAQVAICARDEEELEQRENRFGQSGRGSDDRQMRRHETRLKSKA
jgi:5,10-methylene-tetrahydrofolate dehydrogenase/methenyl tetrahydrofolate cyclohydrolase